MIATDVINCNHHHHISVIWVHFEKLVDEISSGTHWSGTSPIPLPLLCHPPFLQVNGIAAQPHFIILFIVTMATITGVTKSMITAIMTIITLEEKEEREKERKRKRKKEKREKKEREKKIITLVTITRSALPGWG